MARRGISVMAVCATALGTMVLGGAAQAAVVCEDRIVPTPVGVHVTVCVTSVDEATVSLTVSRAGSTLLDVALERYPDITGQNRNELRICSSLLPSDLGFPSDGGCVRLL